MSSHNGLALLLDPARHQLTRRDAKVGDLVVTPRRGKSVETNALWYNAFLDAWRRVYPDRLQELRPVKEEPQGSADAR